MTDQGQFRLLTIHFGLQQLAGAMAGGFVGAYFLKLGFGLPLALCAYAAALAIRFGLRFLSLAFVRRVGFRAALVAGLLVLAAEFYPLAHAADPFWLLGWLFCLALGESLYWTVFHAAFAVVGGSARGRELGLRTAVGAVVGVIGPLIGGILLEHLGPSVDFAVACLVTLAAVVPLLLMRSFDAGPVPRMAHWRDGIDRTSVAAFAADGWLSAGLVLAWPMALFVSMGSQYETFGVANAVAGLAGALTGLVAGRLIDRGRHDWSLSAVSVALAASFLFRAGASWFPPAAALANATGAAVLGLYTPVLMSVIYDRAKRSGAAYRFHFAAEAGWDVGAALGCLAGAALTFATGVPSLSTLPAAAGIWVMYRCVRVSRPATPVAAVVPESAAG